MRIAQIAPLIESVPPGLYGGTERVVSYLTEELVSHGHAVTLFASGDSRTTATLAAVCPKSLRLHPHAGSVVATQLLMLEEVRKRAAEFDILHFHLDLFHYPIFRESPTAHLTTLHGRLDLPGLQEFYAEFADIPVVSISFDQRLPLPPVNWQGTVYHGLPRDLYRFNNQPGDYLAFLGRISQEKRVDRAIHTAIAANLPIKIAAKIDPTDRNYFKEHIEPLFSHSLVEFVGEIGDAEKSEFLGNASALLFPIDWPEPFGLVLIEAMACGTPVIASARGSVPEILTNGVTGFTVNSLDSAVAAVAQIPTLSRQHIREEFERRFTVSQMAENYTRIYEKLLSKPQASYAA